MKHRIARGWAVVGTLVALSGLVVAHLMAERSGDDLSGPLLLLDHLFDLLLALTVVALCAGVGRWALSLFRVPDWRPLEVLLFAVPLGTGGLSLAILVSGLAGGLRPVPLFLLLGAIAVAVRQELAALPSLIARSLTDARRDAGGPELGLFAAAVFAAVAGFLFAFGLAPPVDWDSLMYHLQVPAQFLERGRVYLPDDNLRVSDTNVVHMLYLPLLAAGSEAAPAIVSAVFALCLGATVFAFCARFLPGGAAPVSATLLWSTTTILMVAFTPRVDVTLAWFLFLAQFALFLGWGARDLRPAWLAAVLLGLAAGVKFLAFPYILSLGPFIVWTALRASRGAVAAARALGVFAFLSLAGVAPWLVKNWVLLGAPLYPWFSEPLLTPWMASVLGTPRVPPTVDPDMLRIVAQSRAPFNLRDAFLSPGRISVEPEARFYYANPALALLPAALVLLRHPAVMFLLVPAVSYLAIILAPFPQTNLRYLLPAVPPLTIVVGHLAARAAGRWVRPHLANGALIVFVVAALTPSMQACRTWLHRSSIFEYLAGSQSGSAYASRHVLDYARSWVPLQRLLNRLPPDSRILMLFEARSFGIRRRVIQDHDALAWPLLASHSTARDCLTGTGVTHVLVGIGSARYYRARGADAGLLRVDDFRSFAARCLTPVDSSSGFEVYRLGKREE
ncbi:MAG: hypothetical protein HY560_01775 [Gemmatimonadetes bacterium]|nr:hypothetical protein [Gemmatimonadota bacterium]